MKLDPHHQRRLEATVQLLEESISRCQHMLAGSSAGAGEGVLRVVRTSIDERRRERLALALDRFRATLEEFAARFELRPRPVELSQVLNAEFSSAWVMLENCRPKRMKGYGVAFDPAAAEALNHSVDRLLERVEALRDEVVNGEGE
jgi:hypothetical protein